MNITENTVIYKLREEVRKEGKEVLFRFNFYDLFGELCEEYKGVLELALMDYEFMETLPEDHFLRKLSIKDAKKIIYYDGTYAFDFEVYDTIECGADKRTVCKKLGNLDIRFNEMDKLKSAHDERLSKKIDEMLDDIFKPQKDKEAEL